ncbi:hypothetical protein THAOC_19387, partial [Thalassiosira oceanica]
MIHVVGFALDLWLLAVLFLFMLAVDSSARVITLVEHAYISRAYDTIVIIAQAMDKTSRALAWWYTQRVPSPPLLVVGHMFFVLATKALGLLLEAKDWIHAAAALFNQVSHALVGLVSRSTTALGRQARSALFLASMIRLALLCFGRKQVEALMSRLKAQVSDQLSRARLSLQPLCNRAAHYYCSAIEGAHGVINRAASQVASFVAIAAAIACGIVPSASTLA